MLHLILTCELVHSPKSLACAPGTCVFFSRNGLHGSGKFPAEKFVEGKSTLDASVHPSSMFVANLYIVRFLRHNEHTDHMISGNIPKSMLHL